MLNKLKKRRMLIIVLIIVVYLLVDDVIIIIRSLQTSQRYNPTQLVLSLAAVIGMVTVILIANKLLINRILKCALNGDIEEMERRISYTIPAKSSWLSHQKMYLDISLILINSSELEKANNYLKMISQSPLMLIRDMYELLILIGDDKKELLPHLKHIISRMQSGKKYRQLPNQMMIILRIIRNAVEREITEEDTKYVKALKEGYIKSCLRTLQNFYL